VARYRKKPVVVEAFPWDGSNRRELLAWAAECNPRAPEFLSVVGECVWIATLEGRMRADPGDWIVCGVRREFYPCKPDVFVQICEPEPAGATP
jgi:hypothetical protein